MPLFDHGFVSAFLAHLPRGGNFPEIYHFLPPHVRPPYGLLELKSVGRGNGLPPPHLRARIEAEIYLWSTYSGLQELTQMGSTLLAYLDHQSLTLPHAKATLVFHSLEITGQSDSKNQQARCGKISFVAYIQGLNSPQEQE